MIYDLLQSLLSSSVVTHILSTLVGWSAGPKGLGAIIKRFKQLGMSQGFGGVLRRGVCYRLN